MEGMLVARRYTGAIAPSSLEYRRDWRGEIAVEPMCVPGRAV